MMKESQMMKRPEPATHPTPAPEKIIDDVETLRILSDPLRIRILELVAEPASAKEIAPQLGIAQTKLYYHLNQLEEYGLIRVVQTRLVSGILEKKYQVSAYSFRVDRALLAVGPVVDDPGLALLASVLDSLKADAQRSLQDGLIDASPDGLQPKRLILSRSLVSMTPEKAQLFCERLDALLQELKTMESDGGNAQPYHFAVVWFPSQLKSGDLPPDSPLDESQGELSDER
jgi:DNA-binding transcriptional ArsR family regulator